MKSKYLVMISVFVLLVGSVFAYSILTTKDICPSDDTFPLYQYKDGDKSVIGFTDQQTKQSYFYSDAGLIYATDEGIEILEGC